MNANLEKVLRVLKSRGLFETTNNAELARLSDVSRQWVSKNSGAIQTYLSSAPQPSTADFEYVDKRLLETYVQEAYKQAREERDGSALSRILGAVTGFVLRQETDLINDVQRLPKIIKVGTAVIKLIAQIQTRKDDAGVPIHSKSKQAQYLLTEMNRVTFMDHLFKRADSYSTGGEGNPAFAKSWSLRPKAAEISARVVELILPIIKEEAAKERVTVIPTHMHSSICSGISVTSDAECQLPPELTSFDVSIEQLEQLSVPSIIQLINRAVPSPVLDHLAISLKNTANNNPSLGRTYNVFVSLRSSERRDLGYINYDISGGLQIISFGILYRYASDRYRYSDDLMHTYEMIFRYGWDPDYKRELRQQIAQDQGVGLVEVKKRLTSYANGRQKSVEGSPSLEKFKQESDLLRREVTAVIAFHKPDILNNAIAQSKYRDEFPEDLDWTSSEPEEPELARMKSSVFFFIWTYFEKQIRDAMLSLVDDGIPVHDAIYSKHALPSRDFEKAIQDQTGFEVKISH
jgi:hypothetical protein